MITAVNLMNMLPKDGKAANQLWDGTSLDFSKLRFFSERAYGHIPKEKRNKLESKSTGLIFMGYEPNGYRFYDPETDSVIKKNDVVFLENYIEVEKVNTGKELHSK